jgi:hypothetical protein
MSEPELELEGEAYVGKYELNDIKSIIRFISNTFRLNSEGKNIFYTNLDTGKRIIISKRAAEKLATHYRSGEIYQKTIAHIPQIIEQMLFLEEIPACKENAKYDKYSYYITPANIEGEPYTILSTVGHEGQEIYYDQNVFEGTPKEAFAKARNETSDRKYSRLNEILQKIKEGDWHLAEIKPSESPTASNSKYSKKF